MNMTAADSPSFDACAQDETVAFLSAPSTHGLSPGERVECVETHGAIVFLAGGDAYKMKRAVHLAYFDFSTLEKRLAACQHEFERNSAAAPELYLDVIAVTREADGSLALGGDGLPVEWLVHMARFEQSALLDAHAVAGTLDLSLMEPLADVVVRAHAAAAVAAYGDGEPDGGLSRVVRGVTASFAKVPDVLPAADVAAFTERLQEELTRALPVLHARSQTGCVRLCHGDMHLGNLVMIDMRPTLFDAIEFDDAIAMVDVFYDLAFLLMDLWHRNMPEHANRCFNRYLDMAVDEVACDAGLGGLVAMPLFLAVRASVRTMVALDRAAVAGAQREAACRDAVSYFDLARDLLKAHAPCLVAVGGRSGTGKSTLARALAPQMGRAPGAVHLRSDVLRKRRFGADPLERLPSLAYTPEVTEHVYETMFARAEAALRAGQSVVVDAAFLKADERAAAEQVARACGVRFHGLWLEAPLDVLRARVMQRRGDASDADASVVALQDGFDEGAVTWSRVSAAGEAAATLAAARCEIADDGVTTV